MFTDGELVDVRDIELMWGKNKLVPKLDQIEILNPYRQSDYFYDEVYTPTETTAEWLYKNGHAFWPGKIILNFSILFITLNYFP